MRVMVFGKATQDSEKGAPSTAGAFAAMDRFTEELVKAGVFVAGAGLKNNAQAKRIVFDGPRRTVIDGPFAEARELVAGFSIWEVKDMDEAMAWAKRSPNPMTAPSEMEIRPFYEAADLAEFVRPGESGPGSSRAWPARCGMSILPRSWRRTRWSLPCPNGRGPAFRPIRAPG